MNKEIKLVTFQSKEALEYLNKNGYLECKEKYIDFDKVGYAYNYIVEEMNKSIKNKYNTKYPLWCWVKCYSGICPPKRKGKKVDGFDVKITFKKNIDEVFITDFIRYSFLLNNKYIPCSIKDKNRFLSILKEKSITDEELVAYVRKDKYKESRKDKEFLTICNEIKDSFKRCITTNSKILQGCVYRINKEEIEKIEILDDDGYIYGSLNYIRSNGKRKDWISEFYKQLK